MAIDFPASPTEGQSFIPVTATGSGPVFIYKSGKWTRNSGNASRFNKVVNPTMQISQQNGNNVITTGNYPADCWLTFDTPVTTQRVAQTTPRGSIYRIRLTATSNLTTSNSMFAFTRIEGNRIADLKYGTTGAIWTVLRVGVRSSVAGTFSIALQDSGNVRTIVFPLVVTANTDTEFVFSVPPETTGTFWPKDNTLSGKVQITAYYNSANSVTYAWTNDSKSALPGMALPVSGQTFDIFDVGWYADPNKTGVAPEFQGNHIEDDLQDCLRYWYPAYRMNGVCNSATNGYIWMANYVSMCVTPTRTLVGSLRLYDLTVAPNATAISNYNSNVDSQSLLATASGFIVGRPFCTLVDGQTANYIAVDARL